jgi:hypothetical protein
MGVLAHPVQDLREFRLVEVYFLAVLEREGDVEFLVQLPDLLRDVGEAEGLLYEGVLAGEFPLKSMI